MTNETRPTFQDRLDRIEKINASGGAFEATGALGRSYFDAMRPPARRSLPWKGMTFFFAGALLFKGTVYAWLGAAYDTRVAELAAGNPLERFGAWLMKAEPATHVVAAALRPFLRLG